MAFIGCGLFDVFAMGLAGRPMKCAFCTELYVLLRGEIVEKKGG